MSETGQMDCREMAAELEKAQIVCVIGGPGVGKGTQCTRLAEDLDLVHMSVGDLLRAESEKPATENTIDIKRHMQNGTLVPTWFVQEVLEKSLADNVKNGKYRFLVDGFPRSSDQCLHFTQQGFSAKAVLHFQCSEETMLCRVLGRAAASGRIDDNVGTFRKRYRGFEEEISDIIPFFGQKVVKIDCEPPLTEVYEATKKLVKDIFETPLDNSPKGA